MPRGEQTACQFRTAHDVTLWPIEVADARYMPQAPDLPLNTLPLGEPVRGVLRLRLRAAASIRFEQIALDRLNLYLAGGDEVALKLYELVLGSGLGVLVDTVRPPRSVVRVARTRGDPAGRLRERPGVAPVHAPLLQRAPTAARVLRVSRALPVRRVDGAQQGPPPVCRRRDRGRHPARARGCHARAAGRPGRLRAPLRAGGQSVPEAQRSDPRQRPAGRTPRGGGPHQAHGLRGIRRRAGHRLRRRSGGGTGIPPVLRVGGRGQIRIGAGILHDAARATGAVGDTAPRRAAHQLHRQRGVPVAGRSQGGAVLREDPAAGGRRARDQP